MLWLGIILVVVVAIMWLVTLLVELPLWIAIVVTVVAVLVFAGVLITRKVLAARKAAALERELLKQGAQQADQARPDRRAEILALQQQMKASMDALKRSKVGGGRSALYSLPWYVIVGPPAAGKTTALERSGLPFVGGAKAKVRGTAGTRNCDWWFSRDAILLDTAGRFAVEDEDREEWQAFLSTVKRFRSKRPVDGLVVAVSVAELASAGEAEVEETARKLRERINEVIERLEVVVPIYLLFTKADLVAGFVEFFGDFSKSQRAQAWGATFALDDRRLDDPSKAFQEEFDELVQVLHARMLERLAKERMSEARSRVLQFPIEFESLRTPLSKFVEELCSSDPYADAPILRGFYFSSGTQTGEPMERVLSNMARGLDLHLSPVNRPITEPQSYFVTDLFEKIIFPDRDIAVQSSSKVRRRFRTQGIIAGVAVLLMLLILLPAMHSYAVSRDLVQATSSDVEEARRLLNAGDAGARVRALDILYRRLRLLKKADSKTQIAGWWGPRTAPELLPEVRSLYLSQIREVMEGPVESQLASEVRGIENLVRADAANFQDSYQLLKVYLSLGEPQRLNPAQAAPVLAGVWSRASQGKVEASKLETHARNYLKKLKSDPTWSWKLDSMVVTRAQGRLSQLPLDDLRFGWLAKQAQEVPPLEPHSIFSGPAASYFTAPPGTQVPGMFTALGWKKVRAALNEPESGMQIEPWVLGQSGGEEEGGSMDQLRRLYFKRYVRAWTDFISALEVAAPPDLPNAISQLRVLAEPDGPYMKFFKTLRKNFQLEMEDPDKEKDAVAKGKEMAGKLLPGGGDEKDEEKDGGAEKERELSPVEVHFKPLLRFAFGDDDAHGSNTPSGLSQYLSQLTALEVTLSQMLESENAPSSDFDSELSRTAASVKRLLGRLGPTSRVLLEPLLMTPIRGSRASASAAGQAALAEQWKTEVWNTWQSTLASRFPFANSPIDASVVEFTEFFRPKTGILWGFFDRQLKGRLTVSGSNFVPKNSADAAAFRPDFLQCLGHAQEITQAVFGTAPEPMVPFAVNILPAGSEVAEIALVIDGEEMVYRNEPERWRRAQWPGQGAAPGAVLKVKAASFAKRIPFDGEFGFFRFLNAGQLRASSKPGVVLGSWKIPKEDTKPVQIEFKPTKSKHPFQRYFFSRMRCPDQMLAADG